MFPIEIYVLLWAIVVILGLLVGSFLNVCIYRIPRKESIVVGNSHCTSCNTEIKRYDLIPVFSYLILGGKCRNCKAKISPRYPIIESLNMLSWVLVFIFKGFTLQSIIYCALASALIVVAMIDIDTMEVPPCMDIFILVLGVIALFLPDMPFYERLIGFGAASAILLVIALLTGGMGGGDIKLMAVCGLVVGWKVILLGLLFGIILGGIFAAIKLIRRKTTRKSEMPFVPFLAIGTYAAVLWGMPLLNWYLSLFGL